MGLHGYPSHDPKEERQEVKPEGAVFLKLRPLDLAEANDFVATKHRHHGRVVGHKFSIGVQDSGGGLRGAAIAGRPVSRNLDDGWTCEVLRVATDGVKNACSMLYGASARTAKSMGYELIVTYVLASEPGTSLLAAGWERDCETPGGSWSVPSRPRPNGKQGALFSGVVMDTTGPKVRWSKRLA